MKRAAIYARYSSDQQRARSIDDQVALCRGFAERAGFTIVAVYSDYEISGATVHRPEFARMQADAEAGSFAAILAEDTDRLARGEGDMPQLRRRMEFAGVEIHTCSDGHVTKLIAAFKGITSSLLLENLAQHTHRGLAGVVRDGRSPGGRAFGYRPIAGEPGELAIVPAEADVVRRIFADYAAGLRPREIAAALNDERIAAPRGVRWNASTINGNAKRGHGILVNPLYAGRLTWNRVRMVKNPATGRRVSRPNPAAAHQVAELPQLAIVPAALFDQVQQLKRTRAGAHPVAARRPQRLLSGLVRCASCGGTYQVKGADRSGRRRFYCSTRKESGACANARTVYVDTIERAVLDQLAQLLRAPDLLAAYVTRYNATRRRLAAAAAGRRGKVEQRAGENAREIERALDAIVKGLVDQATIAGRMTQLTAERDRLAAELAQLDDANVVAIHPQAVERYRRDVAELAAALDPAKGLPIAKVEAFRRLVLAVVLHPGARGEPWQLEIKGRLAELLGGRPLSAGKVVAGKRYHQSPQHAGPLFTLRAVAA